MSKLYALKKWLTLEETSRHLSIVFGEEVTEADVLRLALDGHLKLSVYFVNHAEAKPGKVIPIGEAETVPGLPVEGQEPYNVILGIQLNAREVLEIEDEIVTLAGVFILPMIGSERRDVEHAYQNLTYGPAVELQGLDGTFVEARGQIYQLQESFDENEFQCGSRAQLRKIKEDIKTNNIGKAKADELLNQHKQDRKEFLKKRVSKKYYPAGRLPQDSVLVVRKEAIEALKGLQGAKEEAGAVSGSSLENTLIPQNLTKPKIKQRNQVQKTPTDRTLVILGALDVLESETGVTPTWQKVFDYLLSGKYTTGLTATSDIDRKNKVIPILSGGNLDKEKIRDTYRKTIFPGDTSKREDSGKIGKN